MRGEDDLRPRKQGIIEENLGDLLLAIGIRIRNGATRAVNTLGNFARKNALRLCAQHALVLEHVETHPAHLTRLDRFDERRRVDEGAARGIEDHRALTTLRKRLRVEQMPRGGCERSVQTENI